MSKFSTRDIQLFVAGALALIGYRALIGLPYDFTTTGPVQIGVRVVISFITALALPIGIAVLAERALAILLAQIYLWVKFVLGCVVIPVYYYAVPVQSQGLVLMGVPELLVPVVLLALIFWSRSRRFRLEPDA